MRIASLDDKNLLISIRPKYADKILSGEKTVELRRRFPNSEIQGVGVLLYSSSPVQAVVGWARIAKVAKLPISRIWKDYGPEACIPRKEFNEYFSDVRYGFVVVLDESKPFERPVSMARLESKYGIVPPQSYRYLNGEYSQLLNDGRIQVPYRHEHCNRA